MNKKFKSIIDLYEDGLPVLVISRRLGVSRELIFDIVRQYKKIELEFRPRKKPRFIHKDNDILTEQLRVRINEREKTAIEEYCEKNNTTISELIRKSIENQVTGFEYQLINTYSDGVFINRGHPKS